MPIEIKLSPESQANLDKVAGSIDNIINKLEVLASKGVKIKNVDVDKIVKELGMLELKEQEIDQKRQERAARDEARKQRQDASDAAMAAKLEARNAKMNTAYEQEKARIEQLRLAYMNLAFAKVKDETATKMALNEYNKAARGMQEVQNQMASTKSQVGGLAMQTSSLTMIMSELPNAGISARVFIMSLSNNILPLTMQFQQLANSVDDTGKRLGNMKALAMFGKSLLGLNAILMILTTIVVANADKIGEWIDKIVNGTDAVNKLTYANQALLDSMSKSDTQTQSTTSNIIKLGVEIEKYKKGTGDAKHIVDEYNKTLGVHHGKLNDVNQVMQMYKKYAEDYIVWTIKMNAATKLSDDAASEYLAVSEAKTMIAHMGLTQQQNKALTDHYNNAKKGYEKYYKDQTEAHNRFIADTQKGGSALGVFADNKAVGDFLKQGKELGLTAEQINNFIVQTGRAETAYAKYTQKVRAAVNVHPGDFADDKNGEGRKAREKQLRDIYEKEIYYNELIAQLTENNAKEQLIMAKERTDGEQNSFEERFAALARYTENVNSLNNLAERKALAEEEAAWIISKQKLKDNLDKKTISEKEAKDAYAIMESNHQKRIWTIQDEAYKAQNDNLRNSLQENLKIREDVVAEMNRLAEIQAGKNSFEFNQQAAQENINRIKESNDQILEVFADASVKKANLDNDSFFSSQELKRKELSEDVKLAKEKLKNAEENGVGIKEARDNWASVYLKQGQELAKMELEQELYITQKKEELKQQIIEKSLETIKVLEQAYFQQRQEDLEKEYDYAKSINDEKIKDVEDREKAGVISKEEADKEKERLDAVAMSQKKYLDEQEKELKRKQFLLNQGLALAQVVINTALGVTAAAAIPLGAGLPLIPWIYAQGAASTALIVAQTIPAFEKGGTMDKDGEALVGEKRTEVGRNPDGSYFLTPDTPTIMPLKKGTKIYPSIAQSPLAGMDINALETMELNKAINIQVMSNNGYSDKMLMDIKNAQLETVKAIKNQRLIIPRKSMLEHLRGN